MPQQASTYFPANTGFTWNFVATPLDSANNRIEPLTFYRADSFAVVADYKGKLANIVLTKLGPLQTILLQPYSDTLFYHTDGNTGFEYFNISRIKEFLLSLDSLGIDPNFNFVDFFTSLQDWYPVYQFGSAVNTEYLLKQVDTSITYSIFTIPVQFRYLGKRLQDETIQTALGSFDCKKFLTQWKVSANIFQEYSLLTTNDTIWIAPDKWIVQDILPGQYVNLDSLPLPIIDPFSIPGLETKLTDIFVSVKNEKFTPINFVLEQNYPNPFNPITNIEFHIADFEFVSLKVFDILGNEVETLINEQMFPGNYTVKFNGKNLTSGTYFYRLQAGEFIEIKKMVFLK
jgi:hypothetical protein